MLNQEDNISEVLNQIFLFLLDGKMDEAIELLDKTEPSLLNETYSIAFIANLRKFILQYQSGAVFLNAISNGNLAIQPPNDPNRENYVIAQYKQLHSNLNYLTWQTQQIAKGDLKQKVSFLGEFSVAFNKTSANVLVVPLKVCVAVQVFAVLVLIEIPEYPEIPE